MTEKPQETFVDGEGAPAGPYDGLAAEESLWFLPEAVFDASPLDLLPLAPLPRADRCALIDPQDWAAAQAALSGELAELALLYGTLEERLRQGPPGWRHRLALIEAAQLSWWVGDRIPAERLALWEASHLSGVQEDALGLARAAWAVRRLSGGPAPGQGAGLAAFLGRQGLPGQGLPGDVVDLGGLIADLAHLHPVTRAAALFHAWRIMGVEATGSQEATRTIEAAVLAGRIAAEMGRAAEGGFMPQTGSGVRTAGGGSVPDRLSAWLTGAGQALRAALMHLDRLGEWRGRAGEMVADLQGRTPGLMTDVFTGWSMVTAPMAAEITGATRATVQRNLTLLQGRGLIREVTGQGRYRVWTARL